MKKILITGFAIAAIGAVAPASAQTPTATAQQPKAAKPLTRAEVTQEVQQQFSRLDSNRDGFVTEAESDAAAKAVHDRVDKRLDARGDTAFARLDTNKDGSISRAEFDSVMDRRADRSGARVDRLFENADSNKDGRVSLSEATAAATSSFDALDANRDGTLSPGERRQARQKTKASAPGS